MPTNMNHSDAVGAPRPQKTSSTAANLVKAAALAAVLVPLGSVAMEADTITCGFSGYASDANNGGEGCSNSFGNRNRFNFGEYYFDLEFEGLDPEADFDVSVTDIALTDAEFAERAALFPGYECIRLTGAGDGSCYEFLVEFLPAYPSPREWASYTFEIHWDLWDGHPDLDPDRVTVLHSIGVLDNGPGYDEDMCLEYDNCTYDPDPGIRSGDTDFQTFIAAYRPAAVVPEPASLILMGAGIGGVLVRRRLRSRKP